MSNKDIFHGPATVDLKIAITNGTDDAILTYSMPPGKYPTHQEIAAAIVEAVKEAPDDFRLMTKREWWKLTSIEYFGGVYAMLGESTFDKFEPSPAPVQPDMGNHISENIAAALLTAHGVCPHSTGTPAWAQWLTDAVAGVQLQAEPVAEIIECSKMGQQTVKEIEGRWKFLDYGTKLYAGAAPVAHPEPVAWQCKPYHGAFWRECAESTFNDRAKRPDFWKVRALFEGAAPVAQADTAMLDWLELRVVEVDNPSDFTRRMGMFAVPAVDHDGPIEPGDITLREKLLAAMKDTK